MKVLRHFRFQCELLKYIGLTPVELNNENNTVARIIQSIFTVVLVISYTIIAILSSYQRYETSKHTITVSHTFVDIMESCSEILFISTALFLPITRKMTWRNFIKLMNEMEHDLLQNDVKSIGLQKIVSLYVVILILIIFDISWFLTTNDFLHWYCGLLALNKLYYSCFVYFLYSIIIGVKHFYKVLTKKLRNEKYDQDYNEIKKYFFKLQELIRHFNKIFGWQILFLMITTVLIILNVVNDGLYLKQKQQTIWKPQIFCDLTSSLAHVVSVYLSKNSGFFFETNILKK